MLRHRFSILQQVQQPLYSSSEYRQPIMFVSLTAFADPLRSQQPPPVFMTSQQPMISQPMPVFIGQPPLMATCIHHQQPAITSNQPYLLVNPPMARPAVQAPQIGTGSWCKFLTCTAVLRRLTLVGYPNWRQSPFHNGTAHWRTNPPVIVGQPGAQPVFLGGQATNVIFYP